MLKDLHVIMIDYTTILQICNSWNYNLSWLQTCMSSWFASLIKFTGGVQARLLRKSQVARGKVLQTDYHTLVLQTYHNTLVFVSPKAVKVFNLSFQASKLWLTLVSRLPNCDQVVILEPANNDSFLILQNGSLYHEVH